MLPERRSLESGNAACKIMGKCNPFQKYNETNICLKYYSFAGGSVSIPLEKSENNKVQEIGDSFYTTCEANEQSGKTLWIGIERNKDFEWVVRGF